MLKKIWRSIFPTEPSWIKSGTPAQRQALAALIEKGMETGVEEDSTFIPDLSEDCAPVLSVDPDDPAKLWASPAAGYALLGLGRDPVEIYSAYQKQIEDDRVVAYYSGLPPGGVPAISAAAKLLELPFELILEAEQKCHFALATAANVVAELRRP